MAQKLPDTTAMKKKSLKISLKEKKKLWCTDILSGGKLIHFVLRERTTNQAWSNSELLFAWRAAQRDNKLLIKSTI